MINGVLQILFILFVRPIGDIIEKYRVNESRNSPRRRPDRRSEHWMVCMRALTFVFAVGIGGLAAGCGGPRSILVPKDVSAFNNVSEGGNVFVHVANHGLQWEAVIGFDISRHGEDGGDWGASSTLESDGHRYYVFSYALSPGEYTLKATDHVSWEPWTFSFTVEEKEMHLILDYRLVPEWEERHLPGKRNYRAWFEFQI